MVNVTKVLLVQEGAVVLLTCVPEGLLRLVDGSIRHKRVLFTSTWAIDHGLLIRKAALIFFIGLGFIITFPRLNDRSLPRASGSGPVSVRGTLLSSEYINGILNLKITN